MAYLIGNLTRSKPIGVSKLSKDVVPDLNSPISGIQFSAIHVTLHYYLSNLTALRSDKFLFANLTAHRLSSMTNVMLNEV